MAGQSPRGFVGQLGSVGFILRAIAIHCRVFEQFEQDWPFRKIPCNKHNQLENTLDEESIHKCNTKNKLFRKSLTQK